MNTERGIIRAIFAKKEKKSTTAANDLGSLSQRKPLHIPQAGD